MRALVAVLGDVGRSPRTLAHAGSLLGAGYEVHLVGTAQTPLPATLRLHPGLHLHPLQDGGAGGGRGMAAVVATGVRGLRLGWRLARALFGSAVRPDLILVQSPPAIPTLPVAWLAARLSGAAFIVDWHNLGWTLLGLRFGPGHPLVRVARRVELWFGGRADFHLSVSRALARRLAGFGMGDVVVLHDGPAWVRPLPPARRDLPGDPLVVVAPMGWTRDDDLPLLAEALERLAELLESAPPPLFGLRLVVSGDGPLRRAWSERLRAMGTSRIQVETPDVPVDDYPGLLASSHVGLCIHRSSSKLDIPMKVVEMQAVGIPVLALDDDSPLDEIAPPGRGVLRFSNAEELAARLLDALRAGHASTGLLARLTAEARNGGADSWDDRWTQWVRPLLPPDK